MRRVGLVSPAWPPGTLANGIVTYVANLRAGLAAVGVTSGIVANQIASPLPPADAADVVDARDHQVTLGQRVLWKMQEKHAGATLLDRRLGAALTTALQKLHARNPVDLFETEESFGAAAFAKDAIPRPMVVRLHGPWCLVSPALGRPDDQVSFDRRVTAEGRAITAAAAVSSPSRFALQQVRAHYGFPLANAAVVPNPIAVQSETARWRYQDSDKRSVLFVGRFDRLKGGDVVLGAFARLAREIPEARLIFVGPDRGLRDDFGKTWTFPEYVTAHLPADIAGRIDMLGEQGPAKIAELRRTSFVTMLASRFETFSMTAVEALSHGSPLVAPAAAAIVEIVDHERNGLVFAPADAAEAASQLLRLFRDPALAQRLAAAGATDAAQRFAPDVVARQMVSFYQSVLARSP